MTSTVSRCNPAALLRPSDASRSGSHKQQLHTGQVESIMYQTSKRNPRRKRPIGRVLPKAMLLPATVDSIEQLSRQAHFALQAFSMSAGSDRLLVELFRVVYMSWFLKETGVGDAETPLYVRCNKILEEVATRAKREDVWCIPRSEVSTLQQMLFVYGAQITQAPMFLMERCQLQIQTHLRTRNGTPWGD
jgi:hypothetical protein